MTRQIKPTQVLSTPGVDALRLQLVVAEYRARVGQRIREAREKKGWTQRQLAYALPGQADGPTISRWERGGVLPQTDTLEALAKALDVDVSYFLAPEPEREDTTDLLDVLAQPDGSKSQLDRIEAKLDDLLSRPTLEEATEFLRVELTDALERWIGPGQAGPGTPQPDDPEEDQGDDAR